MRKIAALFVMLSFVSACEDEAEPEAPESAENVVAEGEAAEAPAEEAEEAEEAEAEEAAGPAGAEPPAEGETSTLLALREGFAADSSAWMGKSVTVTALFMSATSVDGSLNNVSLVVSEEDYAEDRLAHSMMCAFGDDAPESVDLTQYAPITVRGTVIERFGRAGLEDCQIVE